MRFGDRCCSECLRDEREGLLCCRNRAPGAREAGKVSDGAIFCQDHRSSCEGDFERDQHIEAIDEEHCVCTVRKRAELLLACFSGTLPCSRTQESKALALLELVAVADEGGSGVSRIAMIEKIAELLMRLPEASDILRREGPSVLRVVSAVCSHELRLLQEA